MSARDLALRLGKTGPNQSFSAARPPNQEVSAILVRTLQPGMNNNHRQQALADPSNVFQFACVWSSCVGFFTRPRIVHQDGADPLVVGHFTDTIGQPFPVAFSVEDFFGFTQIVS